MESASDPQKRRRKVPLSHAQIVNAALELVETNGIDALSARALAKQLHCEAMSLYNYYPSMDALRDAIIDQILTEALTRSGERRQTDAVRARAGAYLELAIRYPNAFQLVATRLWKSEIAVSTAKDLIEVFIARGNTVADAWRKGRILGAYMNGAGLALSAWQRDNHASTRTSFDSSTRVPASVAGADAVRADLYAGLDMLIAQLVRDA